VPFGFTSFYPALASARNNKTQAGQFQRLLVRVREAREQRQSIIAIDGISCRGVEQLAGFQACRLSLHDLLRNHRKVAAEDYLSCWNELPQCGQRIFRCRG
jgi:hypothetical protein